MRVTTDDLGHKFAQLLGIGVDGNLSEGLILEVPVSKASIWIHRGCAEGTLTHRRCETVCLLVRQVVKPESVPHQRLALLVNLVANALHAVESSHGGNEHRGMIELINTLHKKAPAAPAAPSEEVLLLREIRDSLKK